MRLGWSAVTRPTLVTVVLPVRNGERHLGRQLAALAEQSYPGPWELLVVDNGSTDGSREAARSFAGELPQLRIVDASSRRGLNHARNIGVDAARGDLLAFCDADDAADPGWLAGLVDAAAGADIVGGVLDGQELNGPVARAWRSQRFIDRPSEQFLPFVPGGNCAVWTSVARHLRWDEEFVFGGSDMEFCWRAHQAGYRIAEAPGAVMRQGYRHGLAELGRQFFAYGLGGPLLYRRFRAHGMRRPPLREVAADWAGLAWGLPASVRSPEQRGQAVKLAALRLGRVVGSVQRRTFFL
jgi:glycosyltransferase involved in cell wall biosynthesis